MHLQGALYRSVGRPERTEKYGTESAIDGGARQKFMAVVKNTNEGVSCLSFLNACLL